VNLTVTPKISPDGFVKMELGTTNSAISSSTVEINSSATVPIINERRASTTVTVQSGQTVVIGGLIGTVDDVRNKKTPFFGDIPGLGALFRSSTKKTERRELLIMLTPQVLTSNHDQPARILDIGSNSRDMLDRSTLRETKQNDEMKNRLIDPLYPNGRNLGRTNAPAKL